MHRQKVSFPAKLEGFLITLGENNMITRREFVAGVTCCAAVAGKLHGQDADNSTSENKVSPCGTYCGACPMYLATQENNDQRTASYMAAMSGGNKPKMAASSEPSPKQPPRENMRCDCCLGGGRILSHVPKCAIRECAATKSKNRRCSDCDEFPCSRITDFSGDGVLHHGELMENLRQLRKMGIKDWAKHEDERWGCPKCKARFSWYDAECPECKTPRSDKLFPLKKA